MGDSIADAITANGVLIDPGALTEKLATLSWGESQFFDKVAEELHVVPVLKLVASRQPIDLQALAAV
jgi:hypothetical protein